MADDRVVFGTIGREYTTDGVARGLRVSSVANDRLVLDTNVYLGDGRTLYGTTAPTPSTPTPGAPAPPSTPPPP
jgi:hypothetical protein